MTERNKAMSKKATKLISLLLSVVMLLGMLPIQISAGAADRLTSAVGYPTGDSDGLILEFSSAGALEVFRTVYGGRILGGNMLLVDGSYEEAVRYEKMPNIASVTYNYTLEAAGIAKISEPHPPIRGSVILAYRRRFSILWEKWRTRRDSPPFTRCALPCWIPV